MPPITFEQLLEFNKQKKDLYSQRSKWPLSEFQTAFNRTLKNCDPYKINRKAASNFGDHMLKVTREPAAREEYSYAEKRRHMFHPEEPMRPLLLVNRDTIETSISELEEMGDFLGGSVSGEDTNVYNYILDTADPDDAVVIQESLEIFNQTLGLGLPLEELKTGKTVKSSAEQRNERQKRRRELKKTQAQREKEYEQKLREIDAYKLEKALDSKAIDDRQKRDEFEELKKQREEREKKEAEEKRRLEEERKSAAQKKKEEEERRQKAREEELKKQGAMRSGLEQGVKQYRDEKAPMETRKMNMAMAAAFDEELERVGAGGDVPIDTDRVKKSIDQYFKCAEFEIAEAKGTMDQLTALDPKQLRDRIAQRERDISMHPEGQKQDRKRAGNLWRQMDSTWRVKKNSEQFNQARDAMKAYSEKNKAPTRAENYLAAEVVGRYVSKNIKKAKSDTGKARMAISLAFLKKTMTAADFQAYCNNLNAQRKDDIPHTIGKDGYQFDRTADRYIDPKTIGTVDEVYGETRERLSLVSRGKAELDTRDLALLTALSSLKQKGSGDAVVEKSALEAEVRKVEKDSRFREALQRDGAQNLIAKAWAGQLDKLEGYKEPAPEQVPQIEEVKQQL